MLLFANVVRATVKVNRMEDPRFWPLTARKPLNGFQYNLKQMIASATRTHVPNLVFVGLF